MRCSAVRPQEEILRLNPGRPAHTVDDRALPDGVPSEPADMGTIGGERQAGDVFEGAPEMLTDNRVRSPAALSDVRHQSSRREPESPREDRIDGWPWVLVDDDTPGTVPECCVGEVITSSREHDLGDRAPRLAFATVLHDDPRVTAACGIRDGTTIQNRQPRDADGVEDWPR